MLLISQDGLGMVHFEGAALNVVKAENVDPVHKSRMVERFFAKNPDGCAVLAYQYGKTFTMGIYREFGEGMAVLREVAEAYSEGRNAFRFPYSTDVGGFINLPDPELGAMPWKCRGIVSRYPGVAGDGCPFEQGEGEP